MHFHAGKLYTMVIYFFQPLCDYVTNHFSLSTAKEEKLYKVQSLRETGFSTTQVNTAHKRTAYSRVFSAAMLLSVVVIHPHLVTFT